MQIQKTDIQQGNRIINTKIYVYTCIQKWILITLFISISFDVCVYIYIYIYIYGFVKKSDLPPEIWAEHFAPWIIKGD